MADESIVCFDYPNCNREHAGGAGGVPVHPPKGSRISGDEPLPSEEEWPKREEEKLHTLLVENGSTTGCESPTGATSGCTGKGGSAF